MIIEEFIQNFADQFDNPEITGLLPETRFRDIEEWSSLTALTIIAMVDEIYKVRINGDDIRKSETIEDIFNIVKSRL